VLVVDDEVIARMVISEYLRDCGYKVIKAANAAEALEVLQQIRTGLCRYPTGLGLSENGNWKNATRDRR
jgi:CheY-like chemotaxis protein